MHSSKTDQAEKLWTAWTLAQAAGCSKETVHRSIRSGDILAQRAGRLYVITNAEAQSWLESRRAGGAL